MTFESKTTGLALCAALLVTATPVAAAANLLTNGSFEDPVVPAASYQGFRPGVIGTNNGTPWVYEYHTEPFVDVMTYVVADDFAGYGGKTTPFGQQYYAMGETPYVTITTQGVEGLALGHYELSFWQASLPDQTGAVNVDFRRGRPLAFTSLLGGQQLFTTAAGSDWVRRSVQFDVVQGDAHFIVLSSVVGARGLVDNVQLNLIPAGVPEPGTWGMMLLGFGGLGAVLRRRRSVFG